MPPLYREVLAMLSIMCISGCATSLNSGSEKVQVVTATQKERLCQSLGIVSTEQRLGPNKPSNAMNKALNEVAHKGGNGIFIVSSNLDWAEGASITAEALQCKF
jgi:hypothetical protein